MKRIMGAMALLSVMLACGCIYFPSNNTTTTTTTLIATTTTHTTSTMHTTTTYEPEWKTNSRIQYCQYQARCCGNGICESFSNENECNCPMDCGYCAGNPSICTYRQCVFDESIYPAFACKEYKIPNCCGDRICDSNETCTNCRIDCGNCDAEESIPSSMMLDISCFSAYDPTGCLVQSSKTFSDFMGFTETYDQIQSQLGCQKSCTTFSIVTGSNDNNPLNRLVPNYPYEEMEDDYDSFSIPFLMCLEGGCRCSDLFKYFEDKGFNVYCVGNFLTVPNPPEDTWYSHLNETGLNYMRVVRMLIAKGYPVLMGTKYFDPFGSTVHSVMVYGYEPAAGHPGYYYYNIATPYNSVDPSTCLYLKWQDFAATGQDFGFGKGINFIIPKKGMGLIDPCMSDADCMGTLKCAVNLCQNI